MGRLLRRGTALSKVSEEECTECPNMISRAQFRRSFEVKREHSHPLRLCSMLMDGQPAGFAVFFTSYSTWTGSGLFLEDLFVRESFRGRGVGKALLCQVAEIAEEEGHHTIRLDVLDWNESAIKFYKSLGAEYLQQWRNVVIGENAVGRLGRR
jgi:GNAT superfamily N-acetyltransferase